MRKDGMFRRVSAVKEQSMLCIIKMQIRACFMHVFCIIKTPQYTMTFKYMLTSR